MPSHVEIAAIVGGSVTNSGGPATPEEQWKDYSSSV